jgi:phage protein D
VLDSTVSITVGGQPLATADLTRVRSVDVSEAIGNQTQVSIVVSVEVDNTSHWTSPLDSLIQPFAQFQITINRGSDSLVVPARATSASWSLAAGTLSTLTIAGLDASADLDRKEKDHDWAGVSDSDIATQLLKPLGTARVGTTPKPDSSDKLTRHQRATDWSYLKTLARRNDFDVYVDNVKGAQTPVFDHINPTTEVSTTLDLGYGDLGGAASVQVQLVSGQQVNFTHGTEGSGDQQVTGNDGRGNAMGTQSLGGAVTVLRDPTDVAGSQPADVAARVLAEQSAFGASLSVSLTGPTMPLVRARRTVQVRGLGDLVSGKWLVKSVRHTISPAGHTQALSLTRNALGDQNPPGGTGGLLGALSAAVSL